MLLEPASFINAELTSDYEWQLRAYMMLYDKPKAELVMPLWIFLTTFLWMNGKKYSWQNGILMIPSREAEDKRAEMKPCITMRIIQVQPTGAD